MHRGIHHGRPDGPRNAVDHILVNSLMEEGFRGMSIDVNTEDINISDHNMIRAWFRMGRGDTRRWERKSRRLEQDTKKIKHN